MTGTTGRAQMFDVVPAILTATAGTFDTEAEALTEATLALRRHLDALGQSWGNDVVGTRFGNQYGPAAAIVEANLGALSMGLHRISSALGATAAAYEQTDAGLVVTVVIEDELDRPVEAPEEQP